MAELRWQAVHPDLRRALRPVSWAVWRRRAAALLSGALLGVSLWALALVAGSRLFPVPAASLATWAGAAAICGAAGLLLLRPPRPAEVAREGDRAGLKERLITALELGHADGLLARAQREDAVSALRLGGWRAALRVEWPARRIWAAALLGLAAAALLWLPDKAQEALRARALVQAEADRQADQVARAAAALTQPRQGTPDVLREQAAALLRTLEKELRQTEGGQEAMIDLTEAARELERLVDAPRVNQGRALMELGHGLASTERARQVGEALARGDWSSAQQGLENLAAELQRQPGSENPSGAGANPSSAVNSVQGGENQAAQQSAQSGESPAGQQNVLDSMTRAEREALARLLAQAARHAGADTELGRALQQAARNLMSAQDQRALQSALRQLASQIARAGQSADSQQALQAALRQVQMARQALQSAQTPPQAGQQSGQRGQQLGQSGQQNRQPGAQGRQQSVPGMLPPIGRTPPPEGGTGQQGGRPSDQPAGAPGQAGQNQGFTVLQEMGLLVAPGLGDGQGEGLLMEGQGAQGTQGVEGQFQQGGGGSPGTISSDQVTAGQPGQADGQSRTGEPPREYRRFDMIYAPTRLGGSSTPEWLTGALGEGSGEAVETESSPMGAPPLRPYTQVYAEYEQRAREGIERAELPGSYQEAVKKYFSNLSPEEQWER